MTTGLPVAVVTGGNRGIGLEVCRQLAERGYEVVLGSGDLARGERAAAGLGSRHVHALALDVDSTESVNAAASRVGHDFGRCDVLINNAAIDWPCRQDGSCPRGWTPLFTRARSNRPAALVFHGHAAGADPALRRVAQHRLDLSDDGRAKATAPISVRCWRPMPRACLRTFPRLQASCCGGLVRG